MTQCFIPGRPGATRAQAVRLDARGHSQWVRYYQPYSDAVHSTSLPDGSYLMVGKAPNRPGPPYTSWDYDHWLLKFSARGDSLRRVWLGAAGEYDEPNRVIATTDGGVALVGVRAVQPNTTPRQGIFIKLDSALHEQWRVLLPGATGQFDNGGILTDLQEVAGGHFVVCGGTTLPPSDPRVACGVVMEVAPPPVGQSLGIVIWRWETQTNPLMFPRTMLYGPGGEAQFLGGIVRSDANGRQSDVSLFKLGGLSQPVLLNLCTTPPTLPDLAVTWQPDFTNPRQVTFTVDSTQAAAGPRYAEVSLVRWEFGDGTTAAGWQVQHTYATPQPVRARVCVINNLFCEACQPFFPLGPLGVAQERAAGVSISPNPAPTGHYAVRVSTPTLPAILTVRDALGRVVQTQPTTGPDTALDLAAAPPGIYTVRLSWSDGQTVTRRLIR